MYGKRSGQRLHKGFQKPILEICQMFRWKRKGGYQVNDEIAVDIIREVINIGIGEAANSLSKLVNTRVILKVPDIRIISVKEIHDHIQNEVKNLGVYLSQNFRGLIKGKTILFYTKECSISLLNAIYGQVLETSALSETGIAALNEVGNIIMGSCMAEISNVIEGKLSFDLPHVTVEISEKYFENLLRDLEELDQAILIKNEMQIRERDIQGYLFILLSFEDFSKVIEKLHRQITPGDP